MSLIRQVERLHDPPPPTLPELRSLAKAARKKSPGTNGVPPYLLYFLPDSAFSVVHSRLVTCYESGTLPRELLVSETFCLFKGKGKWQDPDRWRPIAMSNSIYRLLMQWVHATLYPLISPHLHPRQFGGKQGRSPAQATHAFMHDIEQYDGLEAILAFDVYHAFDSPPKHLIRTVLDRLGTPLKLLRIISLALEHGATFIRGAPDEVFTTTHGVKQGCPLSFFLFVVVFEIPLRYLARRGIVFCAYVDDISAPVPPGNSQAIAIAVQEDLSLIPCQCNVLKSECLPLVSPPPTVPSLPKYLHPIAPVQVSCSSPWSSAHAAEPPAWALSTVHPFKVVPHLMHLGHPLSACFDSRSAFDLVRAELSAQIAELHAQPIQVLDRVHLVNTMIPPRLLYRTECLPLSAAQLNNLSSIVERFVLGVTCLPPLVTKKTLYTHRAPRPRPLLFPRPPPHTCPGRHPSEYRAP